MSAHIFESCDLLHWVVGGEMSRPNGRFSAAKRALYALLAFFVLTLIPVTASAKKRPVPKGEDAVTAFIVKDTGSPGFIKSKNADKSLSPASLTKIMTSMLAIESGRMNDVVTIPLEATEVEPSKAGFKEGERIRLRDLVKAAMVNSSNDAAFAIAIYLGGSIDGFVAKMNARARALGMRYTHFTNPAGYDRGVYAGNRTTARDLVLLTEQALRYPEFNAIAKLNRAVFSELSTGKTYYLRTHNKLLNRYQYTVGIKTGYTSKAGPCLIARAQKDDKDMLVILLHARTDRWSLASRMFNHGFGISDETVTATKRKVKAKKPAVVTRRKSAGSSQKSAAAPARVRTSEPASRVSRVLAERNRALEALRQKVELQSSSRGE